MCVIDYWGVRLDTGMPGNIFSCNVVATCGFSSHNCVTKSKQVEVKIKLEKRSKNKK